jgi:1-acyl-sn-glycerol-3-phosphate acyltransferase
MRTIAFALYFWITFVLSYLLFIPIGVFRAFGAEHTEEVFVVGVVTRYLTHILRVAGVKMEVEGLDRLPRDGDICFVANHQGMADIAVVEAAIPMRIGFIAKRELARVPFFGAWMRTLHCVTIERSNPKKARETIERGARNIQGGRPMVLFPEGTRSRSARMAPFRAGSMLLPITAGATIVPLTIDGTYRIVEQHGRVTAGKVRLIVHDPVDASRFSPRQRRELADELWRIIHHGLSGSREEAPEEHKNRL